MEDVGQLLRKTREGRGLTLEEVAEATKIRSVYLEAIERGDLSALPPGVYARGFVRAYAEFLGLDGNEVLTQSGLSAPAAPLSREVTGDGDVTTLSQPGRIRRAIPQIAASAALLAVLLGGYWFLANRHPGSAPPASQPNGTTASQVPAAPPPAAQSPPAPAPPQPVLQVVKRNASQYMVDVGKVDQLQVVLRVGPHPCWIDAEADGHPVEQRTLQPGESRTFTGSQEVRIVAGRASSLTVTVNGQQLEPATSDVLTYTVKKSSS
ncbi:MAG: helix-turn-helix domain-containing protein [Kyrpidia tusciae]|nr:helix-turn-helix domain-containing protein [Kyrpidia tusciae]MBE3553121.1 helix-turn-helix domain-containing protein [Kyrpidia tusciae]